MKFFTTAFACFLVASVASPEVIGETIQLEPTQGILIPAPVAESLRFARSAYGGYSAPAPAAAPSYSPPAPAAPSYSAPAPAPVSIPAPPCPKNYLFSCQPSLAPVPCAAPSPSYSGAYSHFVPQYALPVVKELY